MLSGPQGKEVGEFSHVPSLYTLLFMKDFSKTNSHFKSQLLAAYVLVTPVSQLVSPLCQVVHSEAPYSKAPEKKGVLWW